MFPTFIPLLSVFILTVLLQLTDENTEYHEFLHWRIKFNSFRDILQQVAQLYLICSLN